jgi:phage terminase Nu1 subunit (DNA packaging protein)
MMELNKLTLTEVSRLLECSERSIQRYVENDKLKSHGEGKRKFWVWQEVREWDLARERAKVRVIQVNPEEPRETTEATEKALLTRAQRELKEIELAKARGETIAIQDYEEALRKMIVPTRLNLLAISSKLRGQIGNEHADLVQAEIIRALRLLAAE